MTKGYSHCITVHGWAILHGPSGEIAVSDGDITYWFDIYIDAYWFAKNN